MLTEQRQPLPKDVEKFVERIKRINKDRLKSLEISYMGMLYADTPTEGFRLEIEGSNVGVFGIEELPENLKVENVSCYPRPDGVCMMITLLRRRTE